MGRIFLAGRGAALRVCSTSCAVLALAASQAHGFWKGDAAIFSGYRQDMQSFSICSGLNTPEYYGFGKLRGRQIHIWEIGAQANYRFTEVFLLGGSISYGQVLGGKIRDSGVADINANPFNSVIAQKYSDCCAPCNCAPEGCACPCAADRQFAPSIPVTASAGGSVWDAQVGLSYVWDVRDHWTLVPTIGYAYDQQRTVYRNASWGPWNVQINGYPCAEEVTFETGESGGEEYLTGVLTTKDPDGRTIFLANNGWSDLGNGASCISFGNCLNATTYRSSWNGGFLGVDLNCSALGDLALSLSYRFYLQQYQGVFSTMGGCEGSTCACNLCPTLYSPIGNLDQSTVNEAEGFSMAPSTMRFASLAYGQKIEGALEHRCGDWVYFLTGGWQYRIANHCSTEACDSSQEVLNGHMDVEEGTSIPLSTRYPIWSGASFQQARWSSWSVMVGLARLF